MKECKVRALIKFNDVLEKVTRNVGDEFECTTERYNFLKEHNAVELVKSVEIEEDKIISIEPTNDVKDEDIIEEVKVVKSKKRKKKDE